jgi:hypothetical protein
LLLGLPIVFFAWTLVQQFCLWYMLIQHSTIYPVCFYFFNIFLYQNIIFKNKIKIILIYF